MLDNSCIQPAVLRQQELARLFAAFARNNKPWTRDQSLWRQHFLLSPADGYLLHKRATVLCQSRNRLGCERV
ncbi:hypothetical protein HBH60_048060 [Parastagonospora nodorum]|nr:hypothetical protein HBH60_048060 [Parastagonospora nodorum]